MISTHVTFQARAAVREVGKVLGLPPPQVDRLVDHLPWRIASALDPARRPPELASLPLDREPWRSLLRAAAALDGLPRHLSIHTGGIVVGDGPLADSLPLERSAKGLVVTQMEMRAVEALGLVKIDLLGNRALAVVADVVRHVEACEGEPVDLDAVPEDDAKAADLLRRGQHARAASRSSRRACATSSCAWSARTQEDAMVALSLIRPGPAGSGMKDAYVRRRRGEEPTPVVHASFDGLLRSTYGVMLYQEDALRVAAAVGGFDLAQADGLRRALSKKRAPEDLPRMEAAFHAGRRGPRRAARGGGARVDPHPQLLGLRLQQGPRGDVRPHLVAGAVAQGAPPRRVPRVRAAQRRGLLRDARLRRGGAPPRLRHRAPVREPLRGGPHGLPRPPAPRPRPGEGPARGHARGARAPSRGRGALPVAHRPAAALARSRSTRSSGSSSRARSTSSTGRGRSSCGRPRSTTSGAPSSAARRRGGARGGMATRPRPGDCSRARRSSSRGAPSPSLPTTRPRSSSSSSSSCSA